ncbi:MAG: sugar-binding protein [Chloroflexota bacterium]
MLRRKRFVLLALLVFTLLVSSAALAQDAPAAAPPSSTDLLKVNILFVGAHPDDDSAAVGTLARYSLDHGAQTGVVTATRGEGGGNSIGRELGPSLGILREAEERAALTQLGVGSVNYLNESDWAFTTSANAAEQFWGYDEPLGNLVRLFRLLKPDVVITMNPSPGSGHGQHQYTAKLATEAFFLAGDPTAFPEQLSDEFLDPWQPLKLYYALNYGGDGLTPSLQVPMTDISPSQFTSYADLKANALRLYRSQGFDNYFTLPAQGFALSPEVFMLAASMLPVADGETDILAGINTGIGQAPAGVELIATPQSFYMAQGTEQQIDVTFRNTSTVDLSDVSLSLSTPDGWAVSDAENVGDLTAGEEASATFTVNVPADADVSAFSRLSARFDATDANGDAHYATKPALVQVTPPVSVELQPIQAVQIYRDWASSIGMESIVGLASTQIALGAGESGTIPVVLTNRSDAAQDVTVTVTTGDAAVTLDAAEQQVTVGAGETQTLNFAVNVADDAAQSSFDVAAQATYGDYDLSSAGAIQVVPTLSVARVDTAPTIDGDFSEYADSPSYDIANTNLWEGATDDAADLTGDFQITYDDEYLYLAVHVADQTVVSNIAPNDIKGHWRSDSVEITIDPQGAGASEHTLTTFKTGIFPFDTEGNVQAERDADANQGPIATTAPDMLFASQATDDGYNIEVAIPWNAVPGNLVAGDDFGFDVLLYDCDKADAAVGENCNEARTAWSAWNEIQGNPRLWGHAHLEE